MPQFLVAANHRPRLTGASKTSASWLAVRSFPPAKVPQFAYVASGRGVIADKCGATVIVATFAGR